MTSAYSSRTFVSASGRLLPRPALSHSRRAARSSTVSRAQGTSSTTHLRDLYVRDFALVDDQHVSFHPHLNIITGQSGSGKSVLLEAIAQLCGAPAREEGIRSGADCAELQGRFCVGVDTLTEVGSILQNHDVPELARLSSSQSTAELILERRLVYIVEH